MVEVFGFTQPMWVEPRWLDIVGVQVDDVGHILELMQGKFVLFNVFNKKQSAIFVQIAFRFELR